MEKENPIITNITQLFVWVWRYLGKERDVMRRNHIFLMCYWIFTVLFLISTPLLLYSTGNMPGNIGWEQFLEQIFLNLNINKIGWFIFWLSVSIITICASSRFHKCNKFILFVIGNISLFYSIVNIYA